MRTFATLAVLAATASAFAPTKNIVELAASTPCLSTLVTAVKAANLTGALSGAGPFTVFAPTNKAFGRLPKQLLAWLLEPEQKEKLSAVLTYHVVAAKVESKDIKDGEVVKTLEGGNVTARITGGKVQIVGGLHGRNIANVVTADVEASNGVVHIIDEVLLPLWISEKAKAFAMAPKNIVELAESVKDLSTLVTAVQAAGLVSTLEGKGPFTVFAPTNEAFAALPKSVLAYLLKPENKAKLVKVLTYHVVAAKVESKDIKDGEVVKTVEGSAVTAHLKDGKVAIEGGFAKNIANVVQADVEASNGVVHIIDQVLLPKMSIDTSALLAAPKNIVELAESVKDLSTLVTAVQAAGLVSTLEGKGPFTVFAPTNEAFAALPKQVLADLLKPENKAKLVKVLTYHVVAAKVESKDISNGQVVKTVEGNTVTAHLKDGKVMIQGGSIKNIATVVQADVEASNGVVHVIDTVLLPSE
jgi:uncharacterized surface protein with fasciclin (FAS1) repeats